MGRSIDRMVEWLGYWLLIMWLAVQLERAWARKTTVGIGNPIASARAAMPQ